jgi:hypothetical protein
MTIEEACKMAEEWKANFYMKDQDHRLLINKYERLKQELEDKDTIIQVLIDKIHNLEEYDT